MIIAILFYIAIAHRRVFFKHLVSFRFFGACGALMTETDDFEPGSPIREPIAGPEIQKELNLSNNSPKNNQTSSNSLPDIFSTPNKTKTPSLRLVDSLKKKVTELVPVQSDVFSQTSSTRSYSVPDIDTPDYGQLESPVSGESYAMDFNEFGSENEI